MTDQCDMSFSGRECDVAAEIEGRRRTGTLYDQQRLERLAAEQPAPSSCTVDSIVLCPACQRGDVWDLPCTDDRSPLQDKRFVDRLFEDVTPNVELTLRGEDDDRTK